MQYIESDIGGSGGLYTSDCPVVAAMILDDGGSGGGDNGLDILMLI
jgi:hypothetical protein